MGLTLQTFANGDTNYIPKHNQNSQAIEDAVDGLSAQIVAASGAAVSTGAAFVALFGTAAAIVGAASFLPVAAGTTLTVAGGYFWRPSNATLVRKVGATVLAFTGVTAGTYYLQVDATGAVTRSDTAAEAVYSVVWSGTAFGAITRLAVVVYGAEDWLASHDSAALGHSYDSLDARLEASEVLAAAAAPLASPHLTGIPTAPTAAAGTNTTQLATTAFTQAAIAALTVGAGDVVGPSSSTSGHVAVFNSATGKLLADSGLTLAGTNTGDQTITLTGDVTGSGTSTFVTSLAATAVTPGSYTYASITVDAKGRITAATNGAAPAGGTVTSVSITTANGVSASVLNPTTTPALTFTLGAITPTSVAATGTVTGSNLSGTNTGNETVTTEGTLINSATAKATPVDADQLGLMDSAAANILKKLSWASLKASLKTYFDTFYGSGSGSVTAVSVTTANGVSGSVANPSTTPAITLSLGDITPSSAVISGASGALPALPTGTASARLRVAEADGVSNVVLFDSFGAGTAVYGRRANGTLAAKSAVASGQGLVTFGGFGYGATAYSTAAAGTFSLNATEAWTDTAQGCEWRFSTTANGGIVRTQVLTIGANGSLTVTGAVTGSNLSGTNTGDQTIALTGDVTGSGAGTFATALTATAVTPGAYTYASITVDAKGRITSASNGTPPTGGTVSTVSVVTANGVSGSVANPTTSPAITLSLGDITPTSVAVTGATMPANGMYLPAANTLGFSSGSAARMRLDANGNLLLGATAANGISLRNSKPMTGATSSYGTYMDGVIQSDVTSTAQNYASVANTAAAVFTLSNLTHYSAYQNALGAGSVVTTQIGFLAQSTLTGAASNYGFRGSIAAATGRWNVYMDGTAQNYFAGNVGIGTGKTVPATALDVAGTVTATAFAGPLTGNASTATTLATSRNIDGQAFNGSADITVIAPGTHAATSKVTPADADEVPLVDSAASNVLKKLTWANLKATLKTYLDSFYAPLSQPFDAAAFFPGVPTASAKVARIPIARAVSFAANFVGSYFSASANATATTLFDVQKNGTSIGTISIASGGTTATFTTTGGAVKTFAAGDVLSIIAPATPDATLADVGFTLAGTR